MKKHLLIVLLSNFFFAQNTKITYNFETNFSENQMKDENIGFYIKGAQEGAKNLKLELIYNDSVSIFQPIESLSINEETDMAKTFCKCEKKIFQKEDSQFYQNSEMFFQKNKYIIKEPIKDDWKITNESIKINDITCYKAEIIEYISLPNNSKKEKKIIAWFAPELPSKFGPGGFGNLPGTILILQNGDVIFKAIEIKKNDKTLLKMDLKGVEVSVEKYNEEVEKSLQGKEIID
jgi:GLPGLI family protein